MFSNGSEMSALACPSTPMPRRRPAARQFSIWGEAGAEAAVGERVPDHGGAGTRGVAEDGVVGVDEVGE